MARPKQRALPTLEKHLPIEPEYLAVLVRGYVISLWGEGES